jgi:hypothetical protein
MASLNIADKKRKRETEDTFLEAKTDTQPLAENQRNCTAISVTFIVFLMSGAKVGLFLSVDSAVYY